MIAPELFIDIRGIKHRKVLFIFQFNSVGCSERKRACPIFKMLSCILSLARTTRKNQIDFQFQK